jgi:hypothetical protein
LDQLFFESIVGKSVSHFYELAKKSYKDGDYSASIALCTRCLYLGENEVNFESTKPLSLIAQNLYKSNMERWIFLRPLAVGIVIRSNRNRRAFSEILTDSGINLGIADWAVLILLIARIILFERWGIFPKSSRAVLKKLFNAMLKN